MNRELQILFITHNSSEVILQAVESLYNNFPIIIVDNASSDATIKIVKEKFPLVEIIALSNNLGYGRASNVVLEKTTLPFVLLLNPDTITNKNEIETLLHESKGLRNCAISGPNLIEANKTKTIKKADWIVGCSMLFNIKLMKKVGFFDEKIFLYGEENDLCYRVKKAGLDMFVIENSYIGHLNQKSSPQNNHYIFLRKFHRTYSSLYLKKKHTSSFKAFRLALGGILKGAIALLLKRGSKIEQRARILASWHFVLGRGAFDAQDKAYYT
jgi:GT2 family glycosyltransferase